MAWLFRATPPSRAIRVPLLMVTVAIATGPATYLAISHASDASDHEEQRLHATVEQAFLEHQIEGQVGYEQRLFGMYVAHGGAGPGPPGRGKGEPRPGDAPPTGRTGGMGSGDGGLWRLLGRLADPGT